MKKARKPKKKKITEKKTEKPIKKKVSKAEVKKVKIRPERVMETEVEIEPQNRFELIERVETFPEKKEVVEKAKKIKKKAKKIRKHKIKEKEMKPEKIRKPEMKKEIKHKRKTKIQKEEVKPKKRIGGGSFIASGVLSILVPAMFYVVLGDFGAFLQDCSLPFSDVNIGNDMIVNCTEMRLVYVVSFLCVFFGAIFIIYGLAKKIVGMKRSSKNV